MHDSDEASGATVTDINTDEVLAGTLCCAITLDQDTFSAAC